MFKMFGRSFLTPIMSAFILIVGCSCGVGKRENFQGEYFVDFPEVKNIVKYLEIRKNKVQTVESENTLELFFPVDRDSIIKFSGYAQELEDDGFNLKTSGKQGLLSHIFIKDNTMINLTLADGEYFEENYNDQIEERRINELKNSELAGVMFTVSKVDLDLLREN